MLRVALHSASMRIDKPSVIKPIDDNPRIPSCHFDFTPYNNLGPRLNNNELLSDYIGKVKRVESVATEKNNSLMRVIVEDNNGNQTRVTLWLEIASLVDPDSFSSTGETIIEAFASLRVTEFRGTLQLESSSATRVYINPNTDLANSMAISFASLQEFHSNPADNQAVIQFTQKPSERNRITIADLQQKDITEIVDQMFTCVASITDFVKGREWYYPSRPIGHKRVHLQEGKYECPRDETQNPEPMHNNRNNL